MAGRAVRLAVAMGALAALAGCVTVPPVTRETMTGPWVQDQRRLSFWVAPNGRYQSSLMVDDSKLGRAAVALSGTGLSLAYYIDRQRSCAFQVVFLDEVTMQLLPDAGKTKLARDCPVGVFVRM